MPEKKNFPFYFYFASASSGDSQKTYSQLPWNFWFLYRGEQEPENDLDILVEFEEDPSFLSTIVAV